MGAIRSATSHVLSRDVTTVQPLTQALRALLAAPGTGVPVLDPDRGEPVGRLSHQSALRVVHSAEVR